MYVNINCRVINRSVDVTRLSQEYSIPAEDSSLILLLYPSPLRQGRMPKAFCHLNISLNGWHWHDPFGLQPFG